MIPRATMRLQLHRSFAFADAARIAPYIARLGVSHVYTSPITTARAGSMHGYDVIDPTRVNSELGGEEGLRAFVAALRAARLGLIVDIVPNHMAAGHENAWWFDVLRHGRESRYAAYFDIDWDAEDEALRGKVLLPVLGKPYREALADREIVLAREGDRSVIRYFDKIFPVADADMAAVEAESPAAFDPTPAEGRERLDRLLARQHYRLAWWRVANDEINWRRFFDINELAGLRMEHPPAFEDVHRLVFRLYAEGLIDGVRVDHIDGLADPAGYCATLRERLDALTAQRPPDVPRARAYVVVEKILLQGEQLPREWQCDGTTGYDFMDEVSAVQHDADGEPALGALWASVSGRSADFKVEEQSARREILARSFAAQLDTCAAAFHLLSRAQGREITRASLRRALIELLAHFPVYRTYATARARPAHDRRFLLSAQAGAMATAMAPDRIALEALVDWLAQIVDTPSCAAIQQRAVTRFQQLSAPVAAKAVEDTAFYRYGRLLSRNDVGFDAVWLGGSVASFHEAMVRRAANDPASLLATATHDHKRGEDVRARLAVLSERADDWAGVLPRWIDECRRLTDDGDTVRAGDIAMLLQTVVGAWPLDLEPDDAEGRVAFAERLAQWQQKALREAKLATDWTVPDDVYEAAARAMTLALVGRDTGLALVREIAAFVQGIAPAGAVNALAQTLLKLTVPGVPDIYQGTEFWDFSLVDPDNRRPVDFAARAAVLEAPPADILQAWRDSRVKQDLIARALKLRAQMPRLFSNGSYEPLVVSGTQAERVIAFRRRHESATVTVIVPRIASRLIRGGEIRFARDAWADTAVRFPHPTAWESVLDRGSVVRSTKCVNVAELLANWPVAVLVGQD